MWVITRAINEYEQDGDYFVCVFDKKPNIEQVVKTLNCYEEYAKFLLETGGGRRDIEYTWYYLVEMKNGEIYQS